MLHLLACVADSPPGVLVRNYSYILVQNTKIDWTDFEKIPKVFERFSKMELICTEDQTSFLVWKKITSSTVTKNIMYAVVFENMVVNRVDEDYSFGRKNSLILPNINLNHKGLYACVYSNGISDGVTVYDVTVIVHPVPSYLVIQNCSKDQYCLLEVEHRGNLTCHVRGIFPEVELKWMVLDFDESVIAFTKERIQIKEKDDLFEVSLTATYEVKVLPRNKMSVKCLAVGRNADLFNLTREIDLYFPNALPTETEEQLTKEQGSQYVWIALIVSIAAIVITVIIVTTVIITKRTKGKPLRRTNNIEAAREDENVLVPCELYSGNSIQADLQEKKDIFLRQLKEKYKDLCDGVRPVPYRKDEMLSVNSVFVDCVIESLCLKGAGQRRKKEWKTLQSYLKLFSVREEKSTRRILQGEPGFGKSILCLQVAHDWCNTHSNFSDVDLLILLRLKQLGGVKSIYTAIKCYILPKDTTLNENDIKEIVKTFGSVLVILDGFDEYPDQDTSKESDVISIISRQMFQECTVVITTRSSYIPMNYPPSTKIYRLRGFDENSRLNYIQNLISDGNVDANKIERDIMNAPILSDLSQIPLLFAIFVNLTQESDGIKQVASVTEVFKYIISAFHKHTKNLMVHENVVKYDSFEKDHPALDEICFQAVSNEKQCIVWEKDAIIKKIGLEFYKHYVRIGILVEEEVTKDYPGGSTISDVETRVEVSFVHKLFCEWFASHYLRDHLKQHPEEMLEEFLKHVDPSSLQYVYRFACGLNIDCAKQLISYLPRIDGGVTCAILCIQEQLQAVDHFSRTIENIFLQGIIISGHDSMFLQRSSMKLLEQARRKGMDIKSLCLYNCLSSIDISSIKTSSGIELTPEIPVERLKLNVTNRELKEEEAKSILEILTRFEKLKYVK
ncbi:NACHT, LRR and PYD domains-containing protein 10 [Holothuria leucospilota]|uniref:NACHT, LRR and PYD domains-containing protein 10 n=1 Tax=Holothuria leucospilota TaxID=206669 RepID=A0A9Q0Y8W1_HOLLE|nr:NACHT, LRR and PYD domains-containing protein 10 [Holothuria leucospilota]